MRMQSRAVLASVAAAVVTLVAGAVPAQSAEPATPSPASAQAQGQPPQDPGQVPPNRPERGVVYDGLERDPGGRCPQGFVTRGAADEQGNPFCTHGPDPAPEGVDIATDAEPLSSPPGGGAGTSTAAICDGDGTSGKRTQVVYARSSDRTDRFATYQASIQRWAAGASQVYMDSALETGGQRRIRFVHNASCIVVVSRVTMTTTGDDTFSNTITELSRAGFNRADRKYLVFVDANVYCGIGTIWGDDSPGLTNLNNTSTSHARVDAGCWGVGTAAHEHMHNLGGVQLSASHSSGGWHCVDEYDRMCYSDSPSYPAMQYICSNSGREPLFDCNHDDYYSTSPLAGSYLATRWNAANSEFLIRGAQARWGFVWASQSTAASYTPTGVYRYNSVGGAITVTRGGTGVYAVRFAGIGTPSGTVNVTAYGTGSEACKVANWYPSGADQIVNVRCFTTSGSPVDTRFTASFLAAAADAGELAYVWGDQPTAASYSPSSAYSFNSQGLSNTINREGMGVYTVTLPGLAGWTGNVKVTAYGPGSELCKVQYWVPSGSAQTVRVRCFNAAGSAVDTRFTLTYANRLPLTGLPGSSTGYLFADQPSSPSYTPSSPYQFNGVSSSTENTITRSTTGVYQVTLRGLAGYTDNVQVTAYGPTSTECKVAIWGPSGADQIVNVRCFGTTGSLADSPFTMSYTSMTW